MLALKRLPEKHTLIRPKLAAQIFDILILILISAKYYYGNL